jgi:ribosomal subunit interface protein
MARRREAQRDRYAMKIAVTGHQIEIGDALKSHVSERLEQGVSKYFSDPIDAHVTFSREGAVFHTRVSVHVGKDLFAEANAEAHDVYASFNAAAEHAEKQLRRNKRKLREHH